MCWEEEESASDRKKREAKVKRVQAKYPVGAKLNIKATVSSVDEDGGVYLLFGDQRKYLDRKRLWTKIPKDAKEGDKVVLEAEVTEVDSDGDLVFRLGGSKKTPEAIFLRPENIKVKAEKK